MKQTNENWFLPLIGVSGALLLLLDAQTPHGMSVVAFYLIPVLLSLLTRNPTFPLVAAGLATALVIAGQVLSPAGIDAWKGVFNRGAAVAVIWAFALTLRQVIRSRTRSEQQSWLKTGQAELAARVRGDNTLEKIADNALRYLANCLGSRVGALYATQLNGGSRVELVRTATYAYPADDPARPAVLQWGEGLVGQAAKEARIVRLDALPADYLTVGSALGEAKPNYLVLVPLAAGNDVRGVLELGFFEEPGEHVFELLESSIEPLGTALRGAQQKRRLEELLEQTQQQTEELQSQQEEMSALNEELEQQNQALKESQSRLENQHAELEQTTQVLEEQKNALDQRNRRLQEAERALRQKTEELEQASRYKSEFLANMSHELRTPLNSALILSKLLADNKPGNLNEEQIRFAETIHSSGSDLLNLINDILDLSKVEAGKLEVRPEPLEVHQLVDAVERVFRPLAGEKQLEFEVELAEDAPAVITTDRQRLEQILKNFLSNAFKFTERGGVALKVVPADSGIAFQVHDSGIGIPEEQQGSVFEAFQQGDGTDSRKYGGTGLGLAITRQLAQLLGGDVSVESAPGKGSVFSVTLPLEVSTEATVPVTAAAASAPAPRPLPAAPVEPEAQAEPQAPARPVFSFTDDRGQSPTDAHQILIVEDDEAFARVLYDLAHEMGFTALVAPSAAEGVELARERLPEAVLLDIRLPDHSGLAVLEQLKSDPRTRHIPVHVVSAEDFALTARRLGAAGYMLKPVKRDELMHAFENLEQHLSGSIKRVLVVEDDAVQRESIVHLIGGEDVDITAVETAGEALDLLSSQTFDCMVMDLTLPDMSGYDLLAKLSPADSSYSYPPVIVYTGRDLSREEEEELRRYSSSIIVKGARSPERLLSEVTLFLHRVETELPPERQKMLKDLRNREEVLDGARLLVVDDDVRNIFALSSALEPHGAKIEIARNGREALEKLDASPDMDLVLMDIMMPEMNGYEAMREIRAQKRFAKLPIIAVTAKAMRDDQQACLAAGANDYLAKPVDLDKLLSLLRVWLSSRKGV